MEFTDGGSNIYQTQVDFWRIIPRLFIILYDSINTEVKNYGVFVNYTKSRKLSACFSARNYLLLYRANEKLCVLCFDYCVRHLTLMNKAMITICFQLVVRL